MGALSDILKAKLETLLGERGTGKDAAVRRGELDSLLSKAVNLSASKAGAAPAQVAEALRIAKRAEAAVEALRAAQAEAVSDTADDTAQNQRLSEAISLLFQWNGGTYTLRVPAAGITGKVLEDQIADEAISIAKFATGIKPVEVLGSLPTSGNFAGRMVFLTTDSKLYRYTGSSWTAAVPASDVTGQLTDAQIAAVAAAKITGQITSPQVADGSITDAKIAGMAASKVTGQLTDAQIAAVAAAKITGQITSTQITDDAITTPKLAAGAVTANEIGAGAVVADKIAANAVTAVKISAGAVETAKLAAGAITAEKISADSVTADKIAANAVTAESIAAGAITAVKVAAGAIETANIAAGAVTADQVAANAITASKISAGAVTTAKIAAGAVTASSIAANAITAGQIAAAAVGAEQIAAQAIAAKHLAIGNFVNLFDGADHASTSPFEPLPATNGGLGFWDTEATYQGQTSLGLDAAWGTGVQYRMREIPVTPGTEYYIEFWAHRNAAWNGVAGNSKLRISNQTGAFVANLSFDAASLTVGAWVKRSGTFMVPAGVTKLNITLNSDATAGWVRLAGFKMRERGGGELVVDGSIEARHVTSGLLITNQAQIGAAIINNAHIVNASVDTLKIGNQAVSADWNSYTAGWLPLSYGALLDVQTLTISDPTVNGCRAWVTYSCQIGMTRSTAGRGRGEFLMNLSDSAGTQAFGYWEINQYLPAGVEMQLPVSMTRSVMLTGGTATITINAGNLDCDTFRFRNRRIEVNVMKR